MSDTAPNFFELFGLPVGFMLDLDRLTERYLDQIAMTHADRLAAADDPDPAVRIDAACSPLLIDEAYRVLRDPLTRAEYLLSLQSRDPLPELAPDGGSEHGVSLLMERMEVRETLAEAASCADPETAVATVLTQLAEESAALDKTLLGLFADPTPDNLRRAREIVGQLRFLGTCRRDAEDRQAGLPPRD